MINVKVAYVLNQSRFLYFTLAMVKARPDSAESGISTGYDRDQSNSPASSNNTKKPPRPSPKQDRSALLNSSMEATEPVEENKKRKKKKKKTKKASTGDTETSETSHADATDESKSHLCIVHQVLFFFVENDILYYFLIVFL